MSNKWKDIKEDIHNRHSEVNEIMWDYAVNSDNNIKRRMSALNDIGWLRELRLNNVYLRKIYKMNKYKDIRVPKKQIYIKDDKVALSERVKVASKLGTTMNGIHGILMLRGTVKSLFEWREWSV